jgi:FtsP/CotA-like multicopper oxidase with cupredoxin domain
VVIHGPSTANYDAEIAPFVVHEWHHATAYDAFHQSLVTSIPPQADMITVNGIGRNNVLKTGSYFQTTFEKDKKYLLRIVNAAVDFHFQFSIDNHMLQVVSADYVPIKPFWTKSLSVGIGQRYGVIVHTNQTSSNGKFWMRTEYFDGSNDPLEANFCQFPQNNFPPNETDTQRVGIVSYKGAGSGDPTTTRWDVTVGCEDTVFEPQVKWSVTPPQNDVMQYAHIVGLNKYNESHGAYRWILDEQSQWLDYDNPTLLDLANTTWNPERVIQPCKLPLH